MTGPAEMSRKHKTILVLVLGSLTAMGPLTIDMYLPAFPSIAESFAVSVDFVQLSLASFFVGLALGQILLGPITDRLGRKPPLYAGLLLYLFTSVACAFTQKVEHLIVLRFFQAVGACSGMVISRAVVRDLFSHQESARIFSLLMLVMGVAPILAPLLGSFIAAQWGWRFLFAVLAVFATLCLVAVSLFLQESQGARPESRIRHAFRTYWSILTDREFLAYTLAGGVAQAGMFAYITGSAFVFIEYYGLSSSQYSLLFGTNAFGLITLSQVNARILQTQSYDQILRRVFSLLATLGIIIIVVGQMDLGFWSLALPLFFSISLLGMTFPNTTAGALAHQAQRAGSASALLGTLQFVIAGLLAAAVSYFHNGTDGPMTAILGSCGILGMLLYFGLIAQAPRHQVP